MLSAKNRMVNCAQQRGTMETIRKANQEDLNAITDIYNEAILNTVATFDTQPKTLEQQQKWLEAHRNRYPVIVFEVEGKVVGWASLSQWSDRCAYSDTAEISTYIHKDYRGRGIGKKLKATLIDEAKKSGFHSLLSRVAGDNVASIELNKKFDFFLVGTMREVGKKFGKLHDVHLFQLLLRN